MMGGTDVVAMVQTGPRALELRQLRRPEIGDNEALIRVEACGVCGSDIAMYNKADEPGYPLIRGHEAVGTIEEIGRNLAERHHLKPGDRVAVDPFIRCGTCRYCLAGRGELCAGGDRPHNSYAMIPLSVQPGLWGGFATHLLATSQTLLHPVPEHVPATLAALFNVLGAGIKWTVDVAGARIGSTVAVLGCGQRGIACALAALETGAELVAVTGLAQDAHKLKLAKELGVHLCINVENEDLRDVLSGQTDLGVDIVIDTTPSAPQALTDAVEIVRPGGKIVSAGMKGRPLDGFPIDQVTRKEITIQGVLGVGADQYRRAIGMIAHTKFPLHRLQTHVLPLERLEYALQVLSGEIPGEHPLNIVIQTT
jgi:threonine dehydrogenase-like Zn-dependent dehydrogenase